MRSRRHLAAGLLVGVALLASACAKAPEEEEATERSASVEAIAGTHLTRVRVTAKAAERLGISTALVREIATRAGVRAKVVDYSALIYDAEGNAFVFSNPEPLVFIRQPITVMAIEGERVFFSGGPSAGTRIVTVGVPELFGIDAGVGGNE